MRWKLEKIRYVARDLPWFVLCLLIFLLYPILLCYFSGHTHNDIKLCGYFFKITNPFMHRSKNWFSFHVCIIVVIQQ